MIRIYKTRMVPVVQDGGVVWSLNLKEKQTSEEKYTGRYLNLRRMQ
jgi:hypothetical protein